MQLRDLPSLPHLHAALDRVDEELRSAVSAANPDLHEAALHLIRAGGKRLRPALCITAALATATHGDPAPLPHAVIQAAAAVELVHLGSLYHDDVLDGARTRRNVPSVNAQWGNFLAIIGGDFLLARASMLAAALGTEATRRLAATIAELCEGQSLEHQFAYDTRRSIAEYEASISGKTASLLATSAYLGARANDISVPLAHALAAFGHDFGMAFQIRDDVLDVAGNVAFLGKPVGNDISEGTYTLPVLLALHDPERADKLRTLLTHDVSDAQRHEALTLVREGTALDDALDVGKIWTQQARSALDVFPENDIVLALRSMCDDLFEELDTTQLA